MARHTALLAVAVAVAVAGTAASPMQADGRDAGSRSEGSCPSCFSLAVDWASGGPATTLPTANFSVRKLEAFHYPPDGRTYAYADIVNYSDPYYPISYSSEVGAFSSPDGFTGWQYHGIVVPRGKPGSWDGAGIASPGAAVAADGTVLIGWAVR